jgi:hypothetical protein
MSAYLTKQTRLILASASLAVTVFVLTLFYYWFAIVDRYFVFLYYHDMRPRFPDTSPFSEVTGSRYWMAGLVAGGGVMVLYLAVNWLLGRLVTGYRPPVWWQVWLLCAGPLLIGLPAITMTVNQPTLPPLNAAQVVLVTLIGLALALVPGRLAAGNPGELIWLAADGFALMLILLSLPPLEDVSRWFAGGNAWRVGILAMSLAVGVMGLLLMTGLRFWRRKAVPSATAILVAGLCVAYLLLPLVRYLAFSDGYYYISSYPNFFTRHVVLQIVIWLVAVALVVGVTRLRERLANVRHNQTTAPPGRDN